MKKFWAAGLSLSIALLSIGPEASQSLASEFNAAKPLRLKTLSLPASAVVKGFADIRVRSSTPRTPRLLGGVQVLTRQLAGRGNAPSADLEQGLLEQVYSKVSASAETIPVETDAVGRDLSQGPMPVPGVILSRPSAKGPGWASRALAGLAAFTAVGAPALAHAAPAPLAASLQGAAAAALTTALSAVAAAFWPVVVVTAAAVAIVAAIEALHFAIAGSLIFLGRHATENDFAAAQEALAHKDPALAKLVGIYPAVRGLLRPMYGAVLGGKIYIRPEWAWWQPAFEIVARYQYGLLKAYRGREPPSPGALGLPRHILNDVEARNSTLFKKFKIPLIEQVLSQAHLSWKLDQPSVDILVLNPASEELKDDSIYKNISGNKATVTVNKNAAPQKELAKPENKRRFQAVILDQSEAFLRHPFELVESLYQSLRNQGAVILTFGAADPGAEAWDKFLRSWKAPDRGTFLITRVALEDGRRALVAQKREERRGIWLKPVKGALISRSVPRAWRTEKDREAGWQALREAGFAGQADEFRKLDVQIEHVWGVDSANGAPAKADAPSWLREGRPFQAIYLSVPLGHAARVRDAVLKISEEAEAAGSAEKPAGPSGALAKESRADSRNPRGIMRYMSIGSGIFDHEAFLLRPDHIDFTGEGDEDQDGHNTLTSGICLRLAKMARVTAAKVVSWGEKRVFFNRIMAAGLMGWQRGEDVITVPMGVTDSPRHILAQYFSDLVLRKNPFGENTMVLASNGNGGYLGPKAAGKWKRSSPSVGKWVFSVGAGVALYAPPSSNFDPGYLVPYRKLFGVSVNGGEPSLKPGKRNPNAVLSTRSKYAPRSPDDTEDGKNSGIVGASAAVEAATAIALLVKNALRRKNAIHGFVLDTLPLVIGAVMMRSAGDMQVPIWFQDAGFLDTSDAAESAAVKLALSLDWSDRSRDLDWIKKIRAILRLQDWVYRHVEVPAAQVQAQARFDDSAEVSVNPASYSPGNLVYAKALEAFGRDRLKVLPALLRHLKDPVWLVRLQAVHALLNLYSAPWIKQPSLEEAQALAQAAAALADAGLNDPDGRVSQTALLVLAELPALSRDVSTKLTEAVNSPRWELGVYAAYVLARRGDLSALSRIDRELDNPNELARFTAIALLGQMKGGMRGFEAEILSAKARDRSERENIRHLSVASLANGVLNDPGGGEQDAVVDLGPTSDHVLGDLLDAAGSENPALTETIAKFFEIALRNPALIRRMRREPLRGSFAGFVQREKFAAAQEDALGEMVRDFAHLTGIVLEPAKSPGEPLSAAQTSASLARRALHSLVPAIALALPVIPAPAQSVSDFGQVELLELKQVAGDGAILVAQGQPGHSAEFVFFENSARKVKAPGVGLEGFWWKKLKLESKFGEDILLKKWKWDSDEQGHWKDFFPYLLNLLAPFEWASGLRAELEEIRNLPIPLIERNRLLNETLTRVVMAMREQIKLKDKSLRDRFLVYTSLARAYNRLEEGKNYFDSFSRAELERIKNLKATALYTIDIFRISERKRWGDGGGSPFATESYHVKDEHGGDEAKQRAAKRMREARLDHFVDFIPNHAGLDGQEMRERPRNFIHIIPERQPKAGEGFKEYEKEMLAKAGPMYDLVKVQTYPGHEGRDYWVLIHHPVIDGHWIDMGQHDFFRRDTWDWLISEGVRLVSEGARGVRIDMASSVIRASYGESWTRQLSAERDAATDPWIKAHLTELVKDFSQRRREFESQNKEFLKEFIDALRRENPEVGVITESYHHFQELSAAGANFNYNKVGLFDAIWGAYNPFKEGGQNNNASGVMEALDDVAFRDWQVGGARWMNFAGTFDEEGNVVDKFTDRALVVYALSLLHKAGFVYNGQEQGTTQEEMLISDQLRRSVDRKKAIPFDISVLINWDKMRLQIAQGVRTILQGTTHEALKKGEMSILEPADNKGSIAAFTYGFADPRDGRQKAILVAGNLSPTRKGQRFNFPKTILSDFGAGFVPRVDKNYVLKDYADMSADGQPKIYKRSGRKLLEDFWIILDGGRFHLFEIEEINPAAPVRAPPAISGGSDLPIPDAKPTETSWGHWTAKLNLLSLAAYFGVQAPQIYRNWGNLTSGHPELLHNLPWIGYSFGMLADLLILPYFLSKNEKPQSFVQTLGIIANMVVLFQLSRTAYMPPFLVWALLPLAASGLVLSYLNHLKKIPQHWWSFYRKAAGVLGLSMIIPGLLDTFKFLHPSIPPLSGVLGITGLLAWGGYLLADHFGRVPALVRHSWEKVSAWLATWLHMFGPVAGLTWAYLNPTGIPGTDIVTGLLALTGALLMLPRAIYIKDKIWFTGAIWSVAVGGWFGFFSRWWLFSRWSPDVWNGIYLAITTVVVGFYLGFVLKQNGKGYSSIWEPLGFLLPVKWRKK